MGSRQLEGKLGIYTLGYIKNLHVWIHYEVGSSQFSKRFVDIKDHLRHCFHTQLIYLKFEEKPENVSEFEFIKRELILAMFGLFMELQGQEHTKLDAFTATRSKDNCCCEGVRTEK